MLTSRVTAFLQKLPLRRKLRAVVIGASVITLLPVMATYGLYEWFAVQAQLREDLDVRAQIIAANSTAALVFNDTAAAKETLSALQETPDVLRACIYRTDSQNEQLKFADYYQSPSAVACAPLAPSEGFPDVSGRMHVEREIIFDDTNAGLIFIEADLRKLWNRIRAIAWASFAISLIVGVLSVVLSRIVERAIARPIVQLHGVMQDVATTSDYSLRAAAQGGDEIGDLGRGFNQMLVQVSQRDSELVAAQKALQFQVTERDRANLELNQTMQKLRSTQDQLVQSEKMASLGGLVAGIAHEINTPIGVALTAASTLQSRSDELQSAYEEGSLRRSVLEKYVAVATEISDMIVKNLGRAAELIHSFKQVAVDQTSSERRRFDLREYIDETLLSLRPRLKKHPYTIKVECPEKIVVDGFPGAFSQILTNLVLNSVIHAFEGRESGEILISAHQDGDFVQLRYTDDGIGMSKEAKKRIFDPFYTTKRGQGGSGLGMHVVFNLVTQTLGGTISLPDTDQGIAFDIRFPLRATT